MSKHRIPILITLVFAASTAVMAAKPAQPMRVLQEKYTNSIPIDPTGVVRLYNTNGSIHVVGTNGRNLEVDAVKVIRGADDDAVRDGKLQTDIEISGNAQMRTIKTIGSFVAVRGGRWASSVDYTLRVPRGVSLSVVNFVGERIRIENIAGKVFVQNTNGRVELVGTSGSMVASTVNGDVIASYSTRPVASARLSTVNGVVEVRVPRGSKLNWVAESLRGDLFTSMPMRGTFDPRGSGRLYRGTIGGNDAPTITTSTMMGNVFLLEGRSDRESAQALKGEPPRLGGPPREIADVEVRSTPVGFRTISKDVINKDFRFVTTLGNVAIGEIQGNAFVRTQAGEVHLDVVSGACEVSSGGGPLKLGDIRGLLNAKTEAGDIIVRAARRGGLLHTDGGNIEVTHAGGPLDLRSGGGSITLRRVNDSVQAVTKSGDIVMTIDPSSKSERLSAKTVQGNVILNIPKDFSAELDATILTSNPSQHMIISDFPGVSILHEKVGSRTRIRAVGLINGGGRRVELVVEEGNIQIRKQ